MAIKIRYLKNQWSFTRRQFRIKIFSYSVALLNAVVPIISSALWNTIYSFWIMIVVGLLWVFTAFILFVALTVIKNDWKDSTNRGTNVFAMTLNQAAFCLFAVQLFVFPSSMIYMINHNTELNIIERINIEAEFIILNVALALSITS